MLIEKVNTSDIANFESTLLKVNQLEGINSILILSCEDNNYTPENMDKILTSIKKPVFGGIFPQLIHGKKTMTEGSLIIGMNHKAKTLAVNVPEADTDRESELLKFEDQLSDSKTMFVFTDGFTSGISSFIDDVFSVFGLELNYVGGGAGSLKKLSSSPCLFSNKGLLQNKAMLIASDINSGIGVNHGWNSISQSFQITESEGNVIKTIDWKPAFEVYKKITEEHSGQKFKQDNFFDIAKAYPFGINKLNNEMIVRDPIAKTENNEIVCVGEVPENSMVNILNGDNESLINAARQSHEEAMNTFSGRADKKSLFVMDCISRVLFLGDEFQKELMTMSSDDSPLFGALSIGEIANTGKSFLEFYNKTIISSYLED
ncbi:MULTISPECIES: FIST signal transduction protein [unclassified Lentimicrobium]|uniref:FIST signal transduction protein n=1 Tax=unclassified Lentimicrobium TaxID=2677434 RepID=UPI0015525C36|nr:MULTISPECIES: FIST C-terminal domain-containing protein [unclassified Lentimicrobium]NPD48137.1 histidine kinase [Lentimicrobium sp. S6]NPD86958.1 histidine kinase [Lentimicrobium sp. L6]